LTYERNKLEKTKQQISTQLNALAAIPDIVSFDVSARTPQVAATALQPGD
jgi:hypothetical protein